MTADGKNMEKLNRIETEMKGRHVKLDCFEFDDVDDGGGGGGGNSDDRNRDGKNADDGATGLRSKCSSCMDDIQMKGLICKYAHRLIGKLDKVAVKAAEHNQCEDAVVRLRDKVLRLIEDLDATGESCQPSTVLLNKYDCYRMAYYSLRDHINGMRRPGRRACASGGRPRRAAESPEKANCKKTENDDGNNENAETAAVAAARDDRQDPPDGRRDKLCNVCGKKMRRGGPRQQGNCSKKPLGWRSFIKHRFFVYFPCLCCMWERT